MRAKRSAAAPESRLAWSFVRASARSFAKPLDTAILHDVGRRFRRIITVEDGTVEGGVGSAVAEFISANGYTAEVVRLGIPDTFIHHGTIAELKRICGYDTEGILTAIRKAAGREKA